MNWRDITYLAHGSVLQQGIFDNLSQLKVLEHLSEYDAVLASTHCLDIDIETSDLDIICEVHDFDRFTNHVRSLYSNLPGFDVRKVDSLNPYIVVKFYFHEFEYELFGQAVVIEQQNAYRHMIQIDRIISLGGHPWKAAIRSLKKQGLKTEPAVARCLKLSGDPYQVVLDLERYPDATLMELMRGGPSL